MNPSEFERTKPKETYSAIMKAKVKYETLLKETVIMEDTDAVRVEMARVFLRDLKEIFQKFKSGN
tara:strand:+ start:3828 stop:4022 length:195 start_codon:yes stop_codon:yes gene_type:complete